MEPAPFGVGQFRHRVFLVFPNFIENRIQHFNRARIILLRAQRAQRHQGVQATVIANNLIKLMGQHTFNLSGRQLHMPDALGGRLHLYFDVITEPVQTIHELAFRDIGEVTAKQAGHLGLR